MRRLRGTEMKSSNPQTPNPTPFHRPEFQLNINRRTFLGEAAYGLGGLAPACLMDLTLLLAAQAPAGGGSQRWKGVVHPAHYPVRARRIIHLCMAGGPSHLESFDYKPRLKRSEERSVGKECRSRWS